MSIASYRELVVWQKSMQLAQETYTLVKLLPAEERFALQDQMRRAAVSIPSNIAEGQARHSVKSFKNFIAIAQGSRAELETQIFLCIQFGYLKEEQARTAFVLCEEVGRMLTALSRRMKE